MPVSILIVEDDAEQRRLLELPLRNLGWDVFSAANAAEGFDLAQKLRPRLLITDVDLPDATGFELCRRMKETPGLAGTPVLMVTGTYRKVEDEARARSLGANAYLHKPYHIADLIKAAKSLVTE